MRHEILAEGCEVWCGDMLEVLPTLGEFDACLTDPPYGIGASSKKFINGTSKSKKEYYEDVCWDTSTPPDRAFQFMLAQSRVQIIWGGNYFGLPPHKCFLVWDKTIHGNSYADCELAWTNLPKVARIKPLNMVSANMDGRVHPTQKPVDLMLWCIDQLPADVGTILDPFMGSGTTGVAAVKKGKAFYGIEREPKYFDIAIRRIEDALRRPDLFIPSPSPKPTQGSLMP